MLKARIHKFIALLLLLAFTSQTMATAAMKCEQEKTASNSAHLAMSEMDMSSMDMSAMDINTMDHSDSAMAHMHHMSSTQAPQHNHQEFDCCKTMGHCLFGGCILAATSNSITFFVNKVEATAEDFYLGIVPSPLASSLYRPPIFS